MILCDIPEALNDAVACVVSEIQRRAERMGFKTEPDDTVIVQVGHVWFVLCNPVLWVGMDTIDENGNVVEGMPVRNIEAYFYPIKTPSRDRPFDVRVAVHVPELCARIWLDNEKPAYAMGGSL
jgi:hypothetical protein